MTNNYDPREWASSSRGTLGPALPPLPQLRALLLQSAHPEKCVRRKTKTSYAKCVAQQAAKNAKATWDRCKAIGAALPKGLSRAKKKKLKRELTKKCLRVGR